MPFFVGRVPDPSIYAFFESAQKTRPTRFTAEGKLRIDMCIRITKTVDSEATVLHVAGALTSEETGVLSNEFRNVDGPVVLELSELKSADAAGVAMLQEIASLGAELRGASPYIELLLRSEPRCPLPPPTTPRSNGPSNGV
jgi:ABC-type transporter Mla MlaB component